MIKLLTRVCEDGCSLCLGSVLVRFLFACSYHSESQLRVNSSFLPFSARLEQEVASFCAELPLPGYHRACSTRGSSAYVDVVVRREANHPETMHR